MALEMKPTSAWWYARYVVNGTLRRVNLGVKIEGERPASITKTGDSAFERSRGKALKEHERVMTEIRSRNNAEELTQRIIEIKTGARMDSVKLRDLPAVWEKLPRKRQPSEQHMTTMQGKLRRFVDFMADRFPDVEELAGVRGEHVQAFLDQEDRRGVSARTWNIALGLLKGVFRKLESGADAYRKSLILTPPKEEDTVHRQPFAVEEIKAILRAAQDDNLMRPLIVTALCTAMRRGDCALLKWANVDMKAGFITVKTGKTGETVEIPILPVLREELTRAPRTESEYVFPQAAEIYEKNPGGLDLRLKGILAQAGFVDAETAERLNSRAKTTPKPSLPVLPVEEVRRRGLEAIAKENMTEAKRTRMRTIFEGYMDGRTMAQLARDLSVSKGTPSHHLNEVERLIGAAVVRRQELPAPRPVIRGLTQAETGNGQRLKRGSVKGWHSFRTTFITLALSAGMPMELVRRVTGHTTVDVVLKHYFRPGREQFRAAMELAMPRLLMNGAKSRDEQLQEIIGRMNPKKLRDEALAILAARA